MTDRSACPACGGGEADVFAFPYPLFRHLDFTRISGPGHGERLGECRTCGTISRVAPPETLGEIDAFYRSDQYAAHDEMHAIAVPGAGDPVPASRVQAEALAGLLPETAPRILDFGCFNGRLLRAFGSLRPDAGLAGYDVAARPGFPEGAHYRFLSGDWRQIEGPFDLVCLSHSIQYVSEVGELLCAIHDWIAPDGVVFVQTPDVTKKACALLLGDLRYHFSAESLTSLLERAGFAVTSLPALPFARDVAVVGRPREMNDAVRAAAQPVLEAALEGIATFDRSVAAHAAGPVDGILGTTIEAAFVDERLGGRASFFIDENPEKDGQPFRGRPVLCPQAAPADARVLVPLGDRSAAVAARLSGRYPADFVPL